MVLDISEPQNWKRGRVFYVFFPFQFFLSLLLIIHVLPVLPSFAKDHLISKGGDSDPPFIRGTQRSQEGPGVTDTKERRGKNKREVARHGGQGALNAVGRNGWE